MTTYASPLGTLETDTRVTAWLDAVDAAEAAVDEQRHADAVELLAHLGVTVREAPALALRALVAEAWARMSLGAVDRAISLLERAREVAEGPQFTDADRARVLYGLGACRLRLGAAANAAALLTLARQLADRAPDASDRLRVEILERRARAYQRLRDWDAAEQDIETALELATASGDDRLQAHVYFAASNVAERQREWLLARFYAEEARALYERAGDRVGASKVLNNLGGISALLGQYDEAVDHIAASLAIAVETGNDADTAYATGSLAQVELTRGDSAAAEAHARSALGLLAARRDCEAEKGNTQIVLGRALAAQGRVAEAAAALEAAETTLEHAGSVGHRAAAWVAKADLAAASGDCESACSLYRAAAELLQDHHF